MTSSETPLSNAYEEYTQYLPSAQSRNTIQTMYNRLRPVLEEFGITHVQDIDTDDCRNVAKHLTALTRDGEIEASTANRYFEDFRAWLSFCVRDGMIDTNPAKKHRANEPLPEEKKSQHEQQFWSVEHRDAILDAADAEAKDAVDELDGPGWATTFRNRAATYTYCYSAARGGEILARTGDPDRNGIRWRDVDLESGTVQVFGKNREYQNAQLPTPAVTVLEDYKEILNPEDEAWPVFPTAHRPTLSTNARESLADRGFGETKIEDILEDADVFEVHRDYGLIPPSLTLGGFYDSFWYDLVDEHDLRINGDVPVLHAARRGLGDELYREKPQLAQLALRHQDIKTTHQKYSHIKASETAEQVDEAIDTKEPRSFQDEALESDDGHESEDDDGQSTFGDWTDDDVGAVTSNATAATAAIGALLQLLLFVLGTLGG